MSKPTTLKKASRIDFSKKNFDSFFASVLLSIRTAGKLYLLLEGCSDAMVLKQFFKASVILIPCTSRGNVEKVFKRLPHSFTNIIGIADRDYDLSPLKDFRLFYYDGNNFEMMLVKEDDIFKEASLFSGYLPGVVLSTLDLVTTKNNILHWLFPVSSFRKLNMNIIPEKDRMSVSDVFPNIFLCKSLTKVKVVNDIKAAIVAHLSIYDNSIISNIISTYDSFVNCSTIDYYALTQGHDFLELFKNEIGVHSDGEMYKIIKKAYTKDLFQKTMLFKNIKMYELNQTLFFLK